MFYGRWGRDKLRFVPFHPPGKETSDREDGVQLGSTHSSLVLYWTYLYSPIKSVLGSVARPLSSLAFVHFTTVPSHS
jgi:hypothetical protein